MKRLTILALVVLTVMALTVPVAHASGVSTSCSFGGNMNSTTSCDPCIPGGSLGAAQTSDPCAPCDPTDPTGGCYVPPCDPTDPTGGCYVPPPCTPAGFHTAGDPCPPSDPDVPNIPVVDAPPAENGRADGGLSFNDADLGVVLYQSQDADGNPTLDVYDMKNNGSEGNFMFNITQEDLAPFVGNPPAENTLLKSGGHVSVYILTTGEVQINVGLDSEGKMHVKIFDGIPWTHVYGYTIDPV